MREDETVGWHHQLNGHEFEQAPGKAWKCNIQHTIFKNHNITQNEETYYMLRAAHLKKKKSGIS